MLSFRHSEWVLWERGLHRFRGNTGFCLGDKKNSSYNSGKIKIKLLATVYFWLKKKYSMCQHKEICIAWRANLTKD